MAATAGAAAAAAGRAAAAAATGAELAPAGAGPVAPEQPAEAAETGADAVPQACEAPQAAPRPAPGCFAWPGEGPVRRVRAQGARGRLADQPPDRGGARRDDP